MRDLHKDLREIHMVGTDTPERIILPKISPLMQDLRIGLTGISDAGDGFAMVRHRPSYGHIVACFSGHGMVLINGRWVRCDAGTAYLTPPGVPHAYRTVPGDRWGFSWVWWHPSITGEAPLIDCIKPVLVRADTEYLRSAIQGLYRESMGPAQQTVIDHWVELIHMYAGRLGGGTGEADPHNLISLWERVDANLAHAWSLRELADATGFSGEHLRRLCNNQTGHGPMKHVTLLRMRRAAMLLESTRQKIGAIAAAVGYDNAFAFSTAFKRQTGTSPAEYRRERGRNRRPPRDATHERKGDGTQPVKIAPQPTEARRTTPRSAVARPAGGRSRGTPA
jgi:AraC-like DNA-binding protein